MQFAARKPILLLARGLDAVGTGREVELVARGLAAAGHDVHLVLTSAGGSLGPRLAASGIPTHVTGARPGTDTASACRLLTLAWRLRPAAIVAFGRTAQRLLADTLFDLFPIHRVQADTAVDNPAERKALEAAGFTCEGLIRRAEVRDGRVYDHLLYSRLRGE